MKTIPVIDVDSPTLGDDLFEAFSSIGFAALQLGENDEGILESVDLCYSVANAFFRLPEEDKLKCVVEGSHGQRGYTPFKTEKAKDQTIADLKEFLQFGYRDNNFFPDSMTSIARSAIVAYSDLFSHFGFLAEHLMGALGERIGLKLKDVVEGQTIIRSIHYPPTGDMEGERSAPHEDINLMTILPAASAAGLQVLASDGSWIDAPTDPNLLILNVGDMLQEFTQGALKSTTHRVVNTESGKTNSRFSIPFFYHPPGDFYLSEKYPKASLYLDERLREIGLK